jgi:hypothetical protein
VREWARINGAVHLKVQAGEALHPETERFVPVGSPFGPCVPARPWSRWRALYFR